MALEVDRAATAVSRRLGIGTSDARPPPGGNFFYSDTHRGACDRGRAQMTTSADSCRTSGSARSGKGRALRESHRAVLATACRGVLARPRTNKSRAAESERGLRAASRLFFDFDDSRRRDRPRAPCAAIAVQGSD